MTLHARTAQESARLGDYRLLASVAASPHGALSAARGDDGSLVLVRRLADEALTLPVSRAAKTARARHPAVIPLVEVVESDRALVSAFELGLPLSLVLRVLMAKRQALPAGIAAAWWVDLLGGLGALESTPDYAPGGLSADSVLITAGGDARLLEAQVASALDAAPAVAKKPERLGYRAPEQLGGGTPSPACDLYALGTMLWEVLHRRRAFPGLDTTQIEQQIRSGAPSVDADVPEALGAILERALATTPSDRYGAPAEMAEALRAACAPLPSAAERAAFFAELLGAHPSFVRLRKKTAGADEHSAVQTRAEASTENDASPEQLAAPPGRERGEPSAAKPVARELPVGRRMVTTPGRRPLPPPPGSKAPAKPSVAPRPPTAPRAATPRPTPAKAHPPAPKIDRAEARGAPAPPPPPRRGADAPKTKAARVPPAPVVEADPVVPPRDAEEEIAVDVDGIDDASRDLSAPGALGAASPLEIDGGRKSDSDSDTDEAVDEAAEAVTRRPDDDVAPEIPPSIKDPRESVHPADSNPPPSLSDGPMRQVGRCELFAEIAHGGMATVHLGRWVGAGGFAKTVAVKALHRQYARDPEFVRMFLDEARVVARIRHPNVMPTIDLVKDEGELFIVMDFVQGATLAHLLRQMKRRRERMPIGIALRIITGVLQGLHAAHEATNERGEPMAIIHRDVSPENILVGVDGYARLIDFGIASALGRAATTKENQVKGKPSYLSPEQVLGEPLDRRTDVYSASVVLWEALTGRRLFKGDNLGALTFKIVHSVVVPPSSRRKEIASAVDEAVMRGLARELDERWPTAEDMAEELERVGGQASLREVGAWVRAVAAERLERSERTLQAVEAAPLTIDDEALERPLEVRAAPSAPIRARLDTLAEDTADDSAASDALRDSDARVIVERSLVDAPDSVDEMMPRRRVPWVVVGVGAAAALVVLIAIGMSGDDPPTEVPATDGPAVSDAPKDAPLVAPPPDPKPEPAPEPKNTGETTPEPKIEPPPPVDPAPPPAPAGNRPPPPPPPNPVTKPNPRLPDDI